MNISNYHGKIINLGDIKVVVKYSARSRSIKIRIAAMVELIIPNGIAFYRAYEFLVAKELWIRNKIRKIPCVENKIPTILFVLGEEYNLVLDDRNIDVPIKIMGNSLVVSHSIAADKVNNIIIFFLKKIIKSEIEIYAAKKAEELGVKYKKINIKDTKSCWGSCSTSGNISFSWRLVMAPRNVMEYVVVHELCHLIEMNHSNKFWALVEKIYPDYIHSRKWLKNSGKTLHRLFI